MDVSGADSGGGGVFPAEGDSDSLLERGTDTMRTLVLSPHLDLLVAGEADAEDPALFRIDQARVGEPYPLRPGDGPGDRDVRRC